MTAKKNPTAPPVRKPYTVKTAAEFLGLSEDTIHRLIKEGVLRASRICPRKLLIPAKDVENLVDSTC